MRILSKVEDKKIVPLPPCHPVDFPIRKAGRFLTWHSLIWKHLAECFASMVNARFFGPHCDGSPKLSACPYGHSQVKP